MDRRGANGVWEGKKKQVKTCEHGYKTVATLEFIRFPVCEVAPLQH